MSLTKKILAGARAPQEFDEAGERNAQTHPADDELKNVDVTEHAKRGALCHIEESGGGKKQRDEDTRQDVTIVVTHAGLLEKAACYMRLRERSRGLLERHRLVHRAARRG
jgi:hypothetical protein